MSNGTDRPAHFEPASCNRKLSRVREDPGRERPHFVAMRPFVSCTTVSIQTTCSDDCPFKGAPNVPGGCFTDAGFTRIRMAKLDLAARNLTAEQVIAEEVREIDASFKGGPVPQDGALGGRDLRLHIGGDVGSASGAEALAGAAARWLQRGGGAVWTYTHDWRIVPKAAWGDVAVLASVEAATDIEEARKRGYPAAIVVEDFPNEHRAFSLPGTSAKVVPCPAETRAAKTCAQCRLCLDRPLLNLNVAIAFKVHGRQAEKAREALRMMNQPAGSPVLRSPENREAGLESNPVSAPATEARSASHGPTDQGSPVATSPFRTANEIATRVAADVDWIAEPWVAAGAITLIDGKPKVAGKSTLVLRMVAAVLSGSAFLGRPTTQSPVVMLSEERPETFRQGLRRAGLLTAGDLHVVFHQDLKEMPWPDVMMLATWKCETVGSRLLIIDTLAQFCADTETNGRKALDAMRPLQAAAAAGIGIVCIRHERKSGGDVGDSARGGTAVTGAADIVLAVKRDAEEHGRARTIHALSRFDGVPGTTTVELGDDGYEVVESGDIAQGR